MRERATMQGLAELDAALNELPKAAGRATLRRVLKLAAQPIVEVARDMAPKLTHELEESIIAGTKLTKRQQRFVKKEGKSSSEIYVGTADPAGIPQEFGTFKEGAQPFLRPAWEETKNDALATISTELGEEIEKTRARVAAKASRIAADNARG
jgi:HK97 gp10 family phage protein